MNSYGKTCIVMFTASLALGLSVPAFPQPTADLVSAAQATSIPAPPKSATAPDDNWHLAISPYLWFAGAHGTAGFRGVDTSYHASFGDIISKFNIGLMGAAEARKKRYVFPVDFMWMKLSDDKALPVNQLGVTSIKAKLTQTVLTPKAGYLFVDQEKLKADATLGIRYWHLGENFSLQPSGINNSQSANWVDVVAGARFTMPLSPKAMITVLGDAGAGGANVDYQVAGLLGYKVKPTVILQLGWRYLDVNYRPSSTFIYDGVTSGILLGVTFNIK
jgi:hypothetical protein